MKIQTPVSTAILMALALMAASSVQAQPWCGTNIDGAKNCVYSTLADCEWMRPDGECVPNPNAEID